MPNCRKQPSRSPHAGKSRIHGKGQTQRHEVLVMSVIMEETASEKESFAEDPMKTHSSDAAPQDRRRSSDEGHVRPNSRTRVRFAPTSPTGIPPEALYSQETTNHELKSSQTSLSPPRSSRVTSHETSSSNSHRRTHSNELQSIPSHRTTRPASSSKGMSCSKSCLTLHSTTSSPEVEAYEMFQEVPRRVRSPMTGPRTKCSPPAYCKMSVPSHRVRPTHSSDRLISPHEMPRSKSPTLHDGEARDARRIGSCRPQSPPPYISELPQSNSSPAALLSKDSPSAKRMYGCRPSLSRHPTASPSNSQVLSRSKSSSRLSSATSDLPHRHHQASSRNAPTSSSDYQRSNPSKMASSLSKGEMRENHRHRLDRVGGQFEKSPSSREMPRAKSSTTLSSMSPSLLQQAKEQHRFLSAQDAPRSRSSSHGQRQVGLSSPSNPDSIPRSVSMSSLSTFALISARSSDPRISLRLRHYEGRFLNRRGKSLFYFSLFPSEKEPMRGVILCLHGIGDHCRRNISHYERLCKEGFGVITYDLMNHGVSDLDEHKTRAHISNFDHLVDDTNDFVLFAKRSIYADALRYWRKHHHPRHPHGRDTNSISLPELPLIIAGTSFGSLVGLHTVLSGEHKFHAGVWGAPTVGVTWNPMLWAQSKLAKPLVAVFPTAKVVPAVQHDLLCRDPAFLPKYQADPLTTMDMMTTRSGHESLQAMVRLQEDERVTNGDSAFCAIPMLFLAGSADGISDQQAAIKFFAVLGNLDKEYKLFDGLYHMVYEEPEKEDVLRYLTQWLHHRFPVETRQ